MLFAAALAVGGAWQPAGAARSPAARHSTPCDGMWSKPPGTPAAPRLSVDGQGGEGVRPGDRLWASLTADNLALKGGARAYLCVGAPGKRPVAVPLEPPQPRKRPGPSRASFKVPKLPPGAEVCVRGYGVAHRAGRLPTDLLCFVVAPSPTGGNDRRKHTGHKDQKPGSKPKKGQPPTPADDGAPLPRPGGPKSGRRQGLADPTAGGPNAADPTLASPTAADPNGGGPPNAGGPNIGGPQATGRAEAGQPEAFPVGTDDRMTVPAEADQVQTAVDRATVRMRAADLGAVRTPPAGLEPAAGKVAARRPPEDRAATAPGPGQTAGAGGPGAGGTRPGDRPDGGRGPDSGSGPAGRGGPDSGGGPGGGRGPDSGGGRLTRI